jgi:L-lactate dehydrogenase complex protein LldG
VTRAREQILSRIRARLAARTPAGRPTDEERRAAIPARATGGADPIELFAARAARTGASLARVERLEAVPAEVARFASEVGASAAAVSRAAWLADLDWAGAGVDATRGPPGPLHELSVTAGWAGIAETGTCAIRAGADDAHSASFLPRANVIVLAAGSVVATMEDVLARLHAEGMPRVLLFVTGPSRTGDIDLRLIIPAQGPGRVHIILVESGAGQ